MHGDIFTTGYGSFGFPKYNHVDFFPAEGALDTAIHEHFGYWSV